MHKMELSLLAYDITDVIDRGEYPLDLGQDDVWAALPAFLALAVAHSVGDGPDEQTARRLRQATQEILTIAGMDIEALTEQGGE